MDDVVVESSFDTYPVVESVSRHTRSFVQIDGVVLHCGVAVCDLQHFNTWRFLGSAPFRDSSANESMKRPGRASL